MSLREQASTSIGCHGRVLSMNGLTSVGRHPHRHRAVSHRPFVLHSGRQDPAIHYSSILSCTVTWRISSSGSGVRSTTPTVQAFQRRAARPPLRAPCDHRRRGTRESTRRRASTQRVAASRGCEPWASIQPDGKRWRDPSKRVRVGDALSIPTKECYVPSGLPRFEPPPIHIRINPDRRELGLNR